MGACKIKYIQADLGIFMYIPAHSGILRHIKTYLKSFGNSWGNPYTIYKFFVLNFMYHFPCDESNHTKVLKCFIILCPWLYVVHSEPCVTMTYRNPGIFRILPNIYDGAFYENS